jgi:hypothetical protein
MAGSVVFGVQLPCAANGSCGPAVSAKSVSAGPQRRLPLSPRAERLRALRSSELLSGAADS